MLPCLSTDSRNGRFEQIIKNNKGGAKGGRKSTPHLTEIAVGEGAGSHRPQTRNRQKRGMLVDVKGWGGGGLPTD